MGIGIMGMLQGTVIITTAKEQATDIITMPKEHNMQEVAVIIIHLLQDMWKKKLKKHQSH